MTPPKDVTARPGSKSRPRRGFSLLLVLFVLTLVGATLLAIGAHFHFTVQQAQTGRMEAQTAQILLSGIAWARLHPLQTPATPGPAPILLDASPVAGQNCSATAIFSWDAERKGWRLTAQIERSGRAMSQSIYLPPQSPESNRADSR